MRKATGHGRSLRRVLAVLLSLAMVLSCVERPYSAKASDSEKAADPLSGFKGWYYSQFKPAGTDEGFREAEVTDYWTVDEDGNIVRSQKDVSASGNASNNMAYLYFEQPYKDFTLEFEYKAADTTETYRGAYFGFGAEAGESWRRAGETDYTGVLFGQYGGMSMMKAGALDHNGTRFLADPISKGVSDKADIKTQYAYGKGDWKADKWQKIKLEVKDGQIHVYSYYNNEWLDSWTDMTYGDWYDGGYVYLASNRAGTMFRNITITENTDTPDESDPFSEEFTDNFTAYRANDGSEFFTGSRTKIDAAEDWRYEDGKYYRIANGQLSYLYTNEAYTDFEMTFQYISAGQIYVGVGAKEQGGGILTRETLEAPSATVIRIHSAGVIQYAPTSGGVDGWFGNNSGNLFTTDEQKKAVHMAKIKVADGMLSVELDGKSQGSIAMQNYEGGYIYIGALSEGEAITLPEIRSAYTSDFTDFTAYYTDRVGQTDLRPVSPGGYWIENEGVISRVAQTISGEGGTEWNENANHLNNMAYLFVEGEYTDYENYIVELDYIMGSGAWRRAYIGFGATEAVSWREENGGSVFFTDGGGATCFEGNLEENGKVTKGWGGTSVANFNADASHHLKLTFQDGSITVEVDGQVVQKLENKAYYAGGRIFLASNSAGTKFSNLKVMTLDEPDEPDPLPEELTDSFTAYRANDGSEFFTGSRTKIDAAEDWRYEDGRYYRIANGQLSYLYTNEAYTDFEMTFQYISAGQIYVGVGAKEQGGGILTRGTLEDPSATVIRIHSAGVIQYAPTSGGVDGWFGNDSGDLFTTDEQKKAVHTAKIKVADGMLSVELDGKSQGSIAMQNYEGGYIYIGALSDGEAITLPEILSADTNNFDAFTAYYTDRVGQADLQPVSPGDYWVENEGVISRAAQTISGEGGTEWNENANHLNNMAYLFVEGEYTDYENYTVELDYTMGSGAWRRAYIGFGATADVSWREENGGSVFFTDSGGAVCFEGNLEENGKVTKGWTGNSVADFNADASHHLKLTFQDGSITVEVDGQLVQTLENKAYYTGGRIFLATNSTGTKFANLKVMTLDEPDEPDPLPAELTDSFTAYRVNDGSEFFTGSRTKIDAAEDWRYEDGRYYRIDNGQRSYLYTNEAYTDFEMTFQFISTGEVYVGVGAKEQGGGILTRGTLEDPSATVLRICKSGVIQYAPTANGVDGWFGNDSGNLFTTDEQLQAVHTAKIKVADGVLSAELDGKSQGGVPMQNYEGGYIYIGALSGREIITLPMIRSIAATNDFSQYDAYYTDSVLKGSLTAVAATDYWTENQGVITRRTESLGSFDGAEWDSSNYHVGNMAFLFLNGEYTESENYSIELDYTAGLDGWKRTYIGFGARGTNGWRAADGGGVLFMDGSGLSCFEGNLNGNGTIIRGMNGAKIANWDENATHHIELVCDGGMYTFYVDGVEVKQLAVNSFNRGGRIFLATNSTGTKFANLKVEILPPSTNDFSQYDAYYTDSVLNGSLTAVDALEYWAEDEGNIVRLPESLGDHDGKEWDSSNYHLGNMAFLFLNGDYTESENYSIELDYTAGTDGWKRTYIGFGARGTNGWRAADGGGVLFMDGNGLSCFEGNLNGNGAITRSMFGAQVANWDEDATHHIKLVCDGGMYTFYVDGVEVKQLAVNNFNRGGRIFLATNSSGTKFSNLKVELLPPSTNDFSQFDAYYTDSVLNHTTTAVDPLEYWTEDDGVIVRRPEHLGEYTGEEWYLSNYHTGNMAFLFLNGAYTDSENYILELDFTAGTDGWKRTYIGFGARGTNGWRAVDGGSVFYMDGSGLSGFDGNINANGKPDRSVNGAKVEGWDENATHHVKLVCNGGIYTFYVDGVEVKKLAVTKFNQGGRIFLATNSSGTKFSNLTVKLLPADGSSMEGWDEWYSPDIRTQDLTDVPEGTNWSIVEGVITRKAIDPELSDSRNYLDMAYLYLTDQTYKNFHLELDYINGSSGWHRSPVGFGAELGKHFMQAGGGITVLVEPAGYLHFDGNNTADGTFSENVFWSSYDEDGNDMTKITPYDEQEWHHLDLTVEDGYATVLIDDFAYYFELNLPPDYDGGYIYLCSNSVVSQYKNIKITDLSANIDQELQAGWQPEEADYAFDFTEKDNGIVAFFQWIYRKLRFR